MKNEKIPGKQGRPREFDADDALRRALEVFWRQGYEGASMQDLTEAMGISRPSLYAAFGNKEALFRRALDKYLEGSTQTQALAEPTAFKVVERLLRAGAGTGGCDNPSGCLLVQGALACGEDSECIRQELNARRAAGEEALRLRFERAKQEDDLPAGAEPEVLARFVATLMNGMAVQAAGGATPEQLHRMVDIVLSSWGSLGSSAG